MSKKTTAYKQCELRKKMSDGEQVRISYIPEQFAKIGQIVKLKKEDVWDDGWVVNSVGHRIEDLEEINRTYGPAGLRS